MLQGLQQPQKSLINMTFVLRNYFRGVFFIIIRVYIWLFTLQLTTVYGDKKDKTPVSSTSIVEKRGLFIL
jgi:hypothetical protein